MKKMLTSGQIARMLGVSCRSVCKWIDSGELPGWRLPGSNERRTSQDALILFMQQKGIPIETIRSRWNVLIGCNKTNQQRYTKQLHAENVTLLVSHNLFEMGVFLYIYNPAVVLFDLPSLGMDSSIEASHLIQRRIRVAVLPEDASFETENQVKKHFDLCFREIELLPSISEIQKLKQQIIGKTKCKPKLTP